MTNQQAPEALRLADSLELCWGDSRLDEAAAELRRLHAENGRLAALVEAQQPAPSAAAAVNPYPHAELRKTWRPGQRWQARSFRNGQWGPWTDAVASEPFWFPHQDYRRHPDDLAPQPSPTPQADSQPAPVHGSLLNIVINHEALATPEEVRSMATELATYRAARAPADSVTAPAGGTNTKTAELLSTTVGLLMGYREGGARQPYKPGSVVAKVIDEVVDHLKDWPYPEPSPTPQADSQPAPVLDGTPPPCDQELFDQGVSVGLFDLPKWTVEEICRGIAAATGARVDWHYIGGRVHIKALPAARAPEDSVTAPAGGAAILKEILAAVCCEDSEAYLTSDQYRKLYDLQRRIESMPTPPAQAADSVLENAARYQWLRSPTTDVALVLDKRTGYVPVDEQVPSVGGYYTYEYRSGAELDAAIDAARKQGGE